jgi:hypothetical protein
VNLLAVEVSDGTYGGPELRILELVWHYSSSEDVVQYFSSRSSCSYSDWFSLSDCASISFSSPDGGVLNHRNRQRRFSECSEDSSSGVDDLKFDDEGLADLSGNGSRVVVVDANRIGSGQIFGH